MTTDSQSLNIFWPLGRLTLGFLIEMKISLEAFCSWRVMSRTLASDGVMLGLFSSHVLTSPNDSSCIRSFALSLNQTFLSTGGFWMSSISRALKLGIGGGGA